MLPPQRYVSQACRNTPLVLEPGRCCRPSHDTDKPGDRPAQSRFVSVAVGDAGGSAHARPRVHRAYSPSSPPDSDRQSASPLATLVKAMHQEETMHIEPGILAATKLSFATIAASGMLLAGPRPCVGR